ncbi:MAG: glycosyltransferase family 2 protein [Lachnospiraceae bacterium]|nr:glycosyltransferase family 2 protein [Lachnospiraceae bacterium]
MKIQNLLLPELGICTEETLYFHREKDREREVSYIEAEKALAFREFGKIFFDSYFNGLSVEKWKKYTQIENINIHLYLQGCFEVTLNNVRMINGRRSVSVLDRRIVDAKEKSEFLFPYKLYEYKGMLAFELKAMENDAIYYGGYYDAEIEDNALQDVDIAINICTYKREPFVKRNIDNLKKAIINNPQSEMYGHLRVYISDNGNTLTDEGVGGNGIHIVNNKNVGGAGGFTRGLIEIIDNQYDFAATHALMMDDDIIITPEALFRTYMLLKCRKEKYKDMLVGGAMMRIDDPAIQVEAGASWNAGQLVSNKANLDMSLVENCLVNEVEEYTEYNAWWYCCMPMTLISKENLPLPIFIRGDDLEYGLRNKRKVVLLNGICVWHEAFENKYSSYLQYYILRNLLYDNAIHFPTYRLSSFLYRLYTTVGREIIYYRYKNINLLYKGVYDFYKGIDFLIHTDGEMLHKEIMQLGYKAVPIEELDKVAYRLPKYQQSFVQSDHGIKKVLRYVTLNGYFLPAKRQKNKECQIVSMSMCRPINFYREKRVLNYDEASGKGFVTEKNWISTLKAMFGLFRITIVSIFSFSRAMKKFRKESTEVMQGEFWEEYLQLGK